ncbi:hypothetical protein F7188_06945 [Helicobacter pylori]|nr:hypothetical protein [Helicobacter pylori]
MFWIKGDPFIFFTKILFYRSMIIARSFIIPLKGTHLKRSFNFKHDYATIRDIMLSIKGVFD